MITGQMFDGFHLLYIVISLLLTVVILFYATKYIKKQSSKDRFLVSMGLLCFFFHISSLWVEYLTNDGVAQVNDYILFPIYFCNLLMITLLVLSLLPNKQSKFYQILSIFTFYGGLFGPTISLIYPTYYLSSGGNLDYYVMKSLISHSFLLIGTMWLYLGGYFKPRLSNVIWYFLGLVVTGILGFITNVIYEVFLNRQINAMWMQAPAIDGTPFDGWLLGVITLFIVGIISVIFELRLPLKDRIFETKKLVLL